MGMNVNNCSPNVNFAVNTGANKNHKTMEISTSIRFSLRLVFHAIKKSILSLPQTLQQRHNTEKGIAAAHKAALFFLSTYLVIISTFSFLFCVL